MSSREVVAFTGHRDLGVHEPKAVELISNWLSAWKDSRKDVYALTGGAAGVDTLAALACARLEIPYTICLPSRDYFNVWIKRFVDKQEMDPKWLRLFDESIDGASKIVYVDKNEKYTKGANFKRNLYMIKYADKLCAVKIAAKKSAGTDHTINNARKFGKDIIILDPSI